MSAPRTTPPVEAFLADFHDRAPGGSPRAFSPVAMTDAQGQPHASSYHALRAALAEALPDLPPGPVLDLACGNGHLLAMLADLGRELLGVDISTGELAAAGQRMGPGARLLQARAQALPLPGGALAAITCHMALMLMSPADAVVAELRRVLAPGGRLLAVLPHAPPRDEPPPPFWQAWLDAMRPEPRDERWQAVRFEGRGWRDPELLPELLAPAFQVRRATPLTGTLRFTPAQAWSWLCGMYDLALLPPDAAPRVRQRFIERLAPHLDPDGTVTVAHRLLLLDAVVAP
jgi:ubiquinone/menaquinone biosynthesis C-methylase UbiE